ncbi:hypothetical protein DPMN_052588 [Dreissena polymorpha]|uniref:Uncharacterized protein n=1 Tax=Dreissena polymorpha TaxID=45954 RepID=A0A9D4CL92_DREPO|nr:hypothetical protein DPMN_052588 [Dreissena polymorpha]
MSIKELGELLMEVYQTLKHVKKAGERFSEEAERILANAYNFIIRGEQGLEKETQVSEQRITSETQAGIEHIERKRHDAEQLLASKIQDSTKRIEYTLQEGIKRFQQAANKTTRVEYEQGKAGSYNKVCFLYTCTHYLFNKQREPYLDSTMDK